MNDLNVRNLIVICYYQIINLSNFADFGLAKLKETDIMRMTAVVGNLIYMYVYFNSQKNF